MQYKVTIVAVLLVLMAVLAWLDSTLPPPALASAQPRQIDGAAYLQPPPPKHQTPTPPIADDFAVPMTTGHSALTRFTMFTVLPEFIPLAQTADVGDTAHSVWDGYVRPFFIFRHVLISRCFYFVLNHAVRPP